MTNNPKPLAIMDHNFNGEDRLFLDANIWLYLYGPQKPRTRAVDVYSDMLKRILTERSKIYIDVLIVSEFINRYARMKWELVKRKNENFKKFRKSSRFNPIAKETAEIASRIMSHCSRIESGFATFDIYDLFDTYSCGSFDFNDQIIGGLCKNMGLILITHDSDFKGQNISILTANQRLLN